MEFSGASGVHFVVFLSSCRVRQRRARDPLASVLIIGGLGVRRVAPGVKLIGIERPPFGQIKRVDSEVDAMRVFDSKLDLADVHLGPWLLGLLGRVGRFWGGVLGV